MGCVTTITADRKPRQGNLVGAMVNVCFHYDSSRLVRGTIIRHDEELPGEMLIELEDGFVIRAVECQHSLPLDIEQAVIGKIVVRAHAGRKKYGQSMERKDLTRKQWLQHAQEEAMDLAIYLERLIRDEH